MSTSGNTTVRKGFDYDSLSAAEALFVQQQTGEIQALMKRTAESIVAIGQGLIAVKECLKHGCFSAWLKAEFDWSTDTAQRFMRVAQVFAGKPQIAVFAPSALYILAAPSTPEAATKEAIARAEVGESITYTAAKKIKQKYTPPPAISKLEPVKPQPELVSPPAPPPPSEGPHSKLKIVAIQPKESTPAPRTAPTSAPGATAPMSSKTNLPPATETVPQPSFSEQPGIWWQLGRNLLYCGDPNSPSFVRQIPEPAKLLLAFPPSCDWQLGIRAKTCIITTKYLPQGKNFILAEEALESNLLLYSNLGDLVVGCFLPSPEILSIINRLERRGLFAEPDEGRCKAVISDWKQARLKTERVSLP